MGRRGWDCCSIEDVFAEKVYRAADENLGLGNQAEVKDKVVFLDARTGIGCGHVVTARELRVSRCNESRICSLNRSASGVLPFDSMMAW